MTLSPDQAAQSLQEIEKTARRSAQAHEYAHSSPQFILWGLIWMVGYTGSYLLPNYGFIHGINWLWFALVVAGVVGSSILGRRRYRDLAPDAIAKAKAIGFRWGMMDRQLEHLEHPSRFHSTILRLLSKLSGSPMIHTGRNDSRTMMMKIPHLILAATYPRSFVTPHV